MELLTNALKHCHEPQVFIDMELTSQWLSLSRCDSGQPLYIGASGLKELTAWPLTLAPHQTIKIYGDELNALYAEVVDSCCLRFYTEEYEPGAGALHNLSEHYGLMIITRLADEFLYRYDVQNQTNLFILKIGLPVAVQA